MVENDIKSEAELFAIADEQKKAGKKDLAIFFISLNESIEWLTWKYLGDGVCKQKSFLLKRNPHGSDSWAFPWEMCRLL